MPIALKLRLSLLLGFVLLLSASFKEPKRAYYLIKVYQLQSQEQINAMDTYLSNAYLPALHRAGYKDIGVFYPAGQDTMKEKKIYVFIPIGNINKVAQIEELPLKDNQLQEAGTAFWNAAYNAAPYQRMENIIIQAFPLMPAHEVPQLAGNKEDHIYELRSYEGPTERLYRQKVKMFNAGGEIDLFKRLQFHAVFYGEVVAGSKMPNLMYMTSFDNMAEREAHWKTFRDDAQWVSIKDLPEYLHTVSKNDQVLLRAKSYSDF